MQLQSIPYSMLKTLLKFQNIFFLIFLSGKLGRKTKLYSFPPVDDLQKVHSFFFFCTLQKVHSDVESPDCTDFFCFLRIPRLHGCAAWLVKAGPRMQWAGSHSSCWAAKNAYHPSGLGWCIETKPNIYYLTTKSQKKIYYLPTETLRV